MIHDAWYFLNVLCLLPGAPGFQRLNRLEFLVSPEKSFLPFPGFPILLASRHWDGGWAPRGKTPWEPGNLYVCQEVDRARVAQEESTTTQQTRRLQIAPGRKRIDCARSLMGSRKVSILPPWAFSIPFTDFSPWGLSLASDNKRFQKPALLPSRPRGLTSLMWTVLNQELLAAPG